MAEAEQQRSGRQAGRHKPAIITMIKTKHFAPPAGPPLGATGLIGIGEKEYILGADANVDADVAVSLLLLPI